MKKFYRKHEFAFALICILIYIFIMAPIKGNLGYGSPWMFIALAVIAILLTGFVKSNHLEEKYGLTGWPSNSKKYLYFIPMWILVTGNLWGGIQPLDQGISLVFAVLSMFIVGYVEELIFRGFLFRAMIPDEGIVRAIVISSITFGIGHIVNLFTGQASLETFIQIFFAISLGYLFTMTFYKSGSLLPGIVAHALINAFSRLGSIDGKVFWIYTILTIVIVLLYCHYLSKLENPKNFKI